MGLVCDGTPDRAFYSALKSRQRVRQKVRQMVEFAGGCGGLGRVESAGASKD